MNFYRHNDINSVLSLSIPVTKYKWLCLYINFYKKNGGGVNIFVRGCNRTFLIRGDSKLNICFTCKDLYFDSCFSSYLFEKDEI